MKKMIKIELERAFSGTGLKLSLIIGMIITIEHYIRNVIPMAVAPLQFYEYNNATSLPLSVFNCWIGGGVNFENELFVRIIPLLAAIPYAITYCSDIRTGIVKNYYIRTKKIHYLFSKYLAVFLTGGTAVTVPLLINFLATAAVLPSIVWPIGSFPINANGMWSSIFYSNPYLYIIMYFCLQFICGGLLATLALIISSWINNIFMALLSPYIICEFLNAITRLAKTAWGKGLAPYRMFSICQVAPNHAVCYILFMIVILCMGVLFYFVKGVHDETF